MIHSSLCDIFMVFYVTWYVYDVYYIILSFWETFRFNEFFFIKIYIAQKVSNINLVTKDFKIVPLTNLHKLLLAGRVVGGGGSVLLGLY